MPRCQVGIFPAKTILFTARNVPTLASLQRGTVTQVKCWLSRRRATVAWASICWAICEVARTEKHGVLKDESGRRGWRQQVPPRTKTNWKHGWKTRRQKERRCFSVHWRTLVSGGAGEQIISWSEPTNHKALSFPLTSAETPGKLDKYCRWRFEWEPSKSSFFPTGMALPLQWHSEKGADEGTNANQEKKLQSRFLKMSRQVCKERRRFHTDIWVETAFCMKQSRCQM